MQVVILGEGYKALHMGIAELSVLALLKVT